MADKILSFLTVLRSGEGVDDLASEIVKRYREHQAAMSKDTLLERVRGSLSEVRSVELSRHAGNAKRLTGTAATEANKSHHL